MTLVTYKQIENYDKKCQIGKRLYENEKHQVERIEMFECQPGDHFGYLVLEWLDGPYQGEYCVRRVYVWATDMSVSSGSGEYMLYTNYDRDKSRAIEYYENVLKTQFDNKVKLIT